MRIAFYDDFLNFRGTSVAVYDYADHNENILGNVSYYITGPLNVNHHDFSQQVVEKTKRRFGERFLIMTKTSIDSFVKEHNIDLVYVINPGYCDMHFPKLSCKTVCHNVFQSTYTFGDVVANISPIVGGNLPIVPHMVTVDSTSENFRGQIGASADTIIFGRYGGYETFDIPFAQETIRTFAIENPKILFLFMSTIPFSSNIPNILYIQQTTDNGLKRRFINTCNYMIHARKQGETFGLACGEFSVCKIPVITYRDSRENEHIRLLGKEGLLYSNSQELLSILTSIKEGKKYTNESNKYLQLTPIEVMKTFNDVFLSGSSLVTDKYGYYICEYFGDKEKNDIIKNQIKSYQVLHISDYQQLEKLTLERMVVCIFVHDRSYYKKTALRSDLIVSVGNGKGEFNPDKDNAEEYIKKLEEKKIPIVIKCNWTNEKIPSFVVNHRPLTSDVIVRNEGKNVILGGTYENIKDDVFFTLEPKCNKGHIPTVWREKESCIERNLAIYCLNYAPHQLPTKPKKDRTLSAVISSEFRLKGHQLRIMFMKHLSSKLSNGKLNGMYSYDLYGRSNVFNLPNYRGPLGETGKELGVERYYYSIAIENSCEKGYFTEKIIDCILLDCIPFYYGCPDISQYIDPRCFIRIDITNPEKAYQTILRSILYNEYEKRKPYLQQTKKRILNMLLFPTIERSLKNTYLPPLKTLVINLDHRVDRWTLFEKRALEVSYEKYERFSATEGKKLVWTDEIESIFSGGEKNWTKNPYGGHNYIPGVIGCSVSHYRIWEEIVKGEDDIVVVLEDDALFCKDFARRWVDTYNLLKQDTKWECVFIGSIDAQHNKELIISDDHEKLGIRQFDGKFRTHGGGTFSYVMKKSAAQKYIEFAKKFQIRLPIDWFMIEHFDKITTYRVYPDLIDHVVASKGGDSDIQVNPGFYKE